MKIGFAIYNRLHYKMVILLVASADSGVHVDV